MIRIAHFPKYPDHDDEPNEPADLIFGLIAVTLLLIALFR